MFDIGWSPSWDIIKWQLVFAGLAVAHGWLAKRIRRPWARFVWAAMGASASAFVVGGSLSFPFMRPPTDTPGIIGIFLMMGLAGLGCALAALVAVITVSLRWPRHLDGLCTWLAAAAVVAPLTFAIRWRS
jgi:hypothetical protein